MKKHITQVRSAEENECRRCLQVCAVRPLSWGSAQETFDAAVKENIEEFGLTPEEAVESAVEEFYLQVGPRGFIL